MNLKEIIADFSAKANNTEAFVVNIPQGYFVSQLANAIGKEQAMKIYAIGRGILLSELEQTIAEYPVLHKKQVLRLFEKEAYVRKDSPIDGGLIPREILLHIVDMLESYTGRVLSQDCNSPLRYLEEACAKLKMEPLVIEDFADYFAERKNRKISQLIAASQKPATTSNDVMAFLADCLGTTAEAVNLGNPITNMRPHIPGITTSETQSDDYYVVVFLLESQFDKVVPNEFVENKTIGELVEFLKN